jgi:ketosteroid isomerase-like protein
LKGDNTAVDFQVIGGAIAHSKDLAYVYGTATVKVAKEGHIQAEKANYMRIWKKEDGNRWKIVLDILSQG